MQRSSPLQEALNSPGEQSEQESVLLNTSVVLLLSTQLLGSIKKKKNPKRMHKRTNSAYSAEKSVPLKTQICKVPNIRIKVARGGSL